MTTLIIRDDLLAHPSFRVAPPIELKLAGDGVERGVVTGYASTFDAQPDLNGDIVAAGAFAATLADHRASGTVPAMLWAHDAGAPIGRWLELQEDSRGLRVRGRLNLDTDRGREAHAHLKAGDVTGLSIGFAVLSGGRTRNRDGSATLKAIDLVEVSVVAMPANRRARVTGVKSLGSQRDLERLLRDTGLSRGAATKLAAGGWPALDNADANDPAIEALAARLEAATRELKTMKKG